MKNYNNIMNLGLLLALLLQNNKTENIMLL
jgi:hypothetical protein